MQNSYSSAKDWRALHRAALSSYDVQTLSHLYQQPICQSIAYGNYPFLDGVHHIPVNG